MRFDFSTANRILFGPGTCLEAAAIAAGFGQRALFVTSTLGGPDLEPLQAALAKSGVALTPFGVGGEPSAALVQQAVDAARAAGCQLVVAAGGGSVMDTGKAAGALLGNPGEVLDYLEVVGKNQPLKQAGAPVIAIPTTAGTGAEVTRNAVLGVPEQKFKVSLRGSQVLPRAAVVDPELTYALPPGITASTGLDALTQVIEPYLSKRANPLVDLWCREGIARAGRALRAAYRCAGQGGAADEPARQAREDMAYTSLLGGLALANAGLGAVHGFASPLGGEYSAPHGAICAALLAPCLRANRRALAERAPGHPALARFEEIARLLTGRPAASAEDGLAWVEETVALLGVPPLSAYGMAPADIPRLVEKAARASSMQANPIVLSEAELSQALAEGIG